MTARIPVDRRRAFRIAGTLIGLAVALGACTHTEEAVQASIPDDYRLRHPIAIQEANRAVVIFVGHARGGLAAARDRRASLSSGGSTPIGDDPAELSEDLRRGRSLRIVAGGPRTLDQEQGLLRKQAVLQFRLRLSAQHGGDDRQPLGLRAAAARNPSLHGAA